MKNEKSCLICGEEATHVCRMVTNTSQKTTPRYMCSKHKHLLEEQGDYICEEVEK